MGILHEFRERLRALLLRAREDRELDEELAFHLEMQIEENLRRGMTPEEAHRQALLKLGGLAQVREATRDARGIRWLEDAAADVRYALRTFRKRPAFAFAAVATLALGIGANAALFGLLDALANRMPTAVPGSDRLVWVLNTGPLEDASYPDFLDMRAQAAPVLDLAAYFDTDVALGSGGEPVRLAAQLVSADYFDVLGVVPARGRAFLPAEDAAPGGRAVVVIGHDLWRRRFGAEPDVVGRAILVNGHPFTVVGIAPPGFVGVNIEHPSELWAPIATQPIAAPLGYDLLADRRSPRFRLLGRLAPAVTRDEASAALAVIARRIEPLEPDRIRPLRFELHPLRGWLPPGAFRGMESTIAFAWVLTALVLLVACANVANLMLARAVARRAEIGVRLAIGAARGRLVRQLLTEAVVLALAAAALGTVIAFHAASWFQARFRGPLAPLDVAPDVRTLGFTLAVALAAALFGLAPAWRASRPDVRPLLAGDGVGTFRRGRLQGALVVAQVTLSVVLLFTAGLFVRRARDAGAVDPGYDTENVVVLSFDLFAQRYDDAARAAFLGELRGRAARVPGVEAATVPAYVPLDGQATFFRVRAERAGSGPAHEGDGQTAAIAVGVARDYFRTLGIPILQGRAFDERDFRDDAAGVVVSASLARRLWPDASPIGRRLQLGSADDAPVLEVVGVARDIAATAVIEEIRALVYIPHNRHFIFRRTSLAARVAGDPAVAARALHSEIRRMDPALPVFDVRTLAEIVDHEIGTQRRLAAVIAGFGALALVLTALGLYGVVAYTVAGRTREIGVRVALGARDGDVVRVFLREGLRLTTIGLGLGALLAVALGRFIAAIVFGVHPLDPAAAIAAAATLAAASALASYLPARRAARVDPMVALRVE